MSTNDKLNSEEKFLEGFVKVERFYKKFKPVILGVGAILIVAGVGLTVKKNIDEQNKLEANIAFEKILKDPKDAQALAKLKETNQKLYDVAVFINARNEGKASDVQVPFLKELSKYSKAIENKSIAELNSLSMEADFLLKEFAIFNKALLLTNEGKYKDAKTALNLIPQTSKAYELANLLKHHLLTK